MLPPQDLVNQAVEASSDKNCASLCVLLSTLAEANVLAAEHVKDAVCKFLHSLDELVIDVPKAGTLGALIVGNLASRGLVSVDLFAALPEDNEFSFSPR